MISGKPAETRFIYNWERLWIAFVVVISILSSTKLLGLSNDAGIILRILQGLSVLTGVIMFIKFDWRNSVLKKTSARAYLLFCALILLLIPRAVLTSLSTGVDLSEMAVNFLFFFNFVFYFAFIGLIKGKEHYSYFNKVISTLAVIAVLLILYILNSPNYINVDSGTTRVILGQTQYDAFRLIIPTSFLIAYAYFNTLSRIIFKHNTQSDYLLLVIFAVGTLVQLHRTVIVSFVLCTLIAVLFSFIGSKPKRLLSTLTVSGLVFVAIGAITLKSGVFGEDYFQNQLLATSEDLASGEGSFFVRFFVFINTWSDVVANYPLLGRGLHWLPMDTETYLLFFEAYSPSMDNTYTNILLVFGFSGIAVFLILITTTMIGSWRQLISKKTNTYYRSKILHILVFLIYLMLNSWSNATMVSPTNIVTIIVLASGSILIHQSQLQQKVNEG